MPNPKADALAMIGNLPDDATWEEIQYQIYLRHRSLTGLSDVEAGRVVSHEEAKREIDEWSLSGRWRQTLRSQEMLP